MTPDDKRYLAEHDPDTLILCAQLPPGKASVAATAKVVELHKAGEAALAAVEVLTEKLLKREGDPQDQVVVSQDEVDAARGGDES